MKVLLRAEVKHVNGQPQRRDEVTQRLIDRLCGDGTPLFVGVNSRALYEVTVIETHDQREPFTAKEWAAIREAVAFRCAGELDLERQDIQALRRAARKMGVADE